MARSHLLILCLFLCACSSASFDNKESAAPLSKRERVRARILEARQRAQQRSPRSDKVDQFSFDDRKRRSNVSLFARGLQQPNNTPFPNRAREPNPDANSPAPLAKGETGRARLTIKGYQYDPKTCQIGPRLEFSTTDTPDNDEERALDRHFRPKRNHDLGPTPRPTQPKIDTHETPRPRGVLLSTEER